MKIYSKKGDDGTTTTISGEKISKNSSIMHIQGSIDELNSSIGIALSINKNKEIKEFLTLIQSDLLIIGTEISLFEKKSNKFKISKFKTEKLEEIIDEIENKLPKLKSFILPGGSLLSSQLHFARTICRRAERDFVRFIEDSKFESLSLKYINRLSDLLFVLARYANQLEKTKDVEWKI